MTLAASIAVSVDAELTNALALATADVQLKKKYRTDLVNGTGVGAADKVWHAQRTLAGSAAEDLDLAGVLTDALGVTVTVARVKAIIITAADGNAGNIVVGGASSNGWVSWVGGATHTITVRPGGTFALMVGDGDATGYTVTAGTADLLHVANTGASAGTYDVIVIGCSA